MFFTPDHHLSALALRTYAVCPLRYRFRYVDGLYWSRLWAMSPEERKATERGQAFHLMARRLYAGLDPGAVADPVDQRDLDHWLTLLQGFLPRTLDRVFHPELELRLNRPELRLQAKFDLVVVDPDGSATIFDWKTERGPFKRADLLRSPQTLVYRYMLCAAGRAYSPTGAFRPEKVSMVFWNPLYPHRWERLPYSEEQFTLDEAYLAGLAQQIGRTPRDDFAATTDQRVCRFCEYRMVCHGQPASEPDPEADDSEVAPLELTEET